MENKLLVEMGRIKSIMGINESLDVLTEGPIDGIISRFITNLAREDERLVLKFFERDLSKQITTDADKLAFSEFVKSVEGKDFIRNLESEIAKIPDPNTKKMAKSQLNRMKNSANSWENIGGGIGGNSGQQFSTVLLNNEATALFGKLGKRLTDEQAKFLNDAAKTIENGVQKLTPIKITQLENELRQLGVSLQSSINQLKKSKDLKSKLKGDALDSYVKSITENLERTTTLVGKVPIFKLMNIAWKMLLAVVALNAYNIVSRLPYIKSIAPQLPNFSDLGGGGQPTPDNKDNSSPSDDDVVIPD